MIKNEDIVCLSKKKNIYKTLDNKHFITAGTILNDTI